ncbi:MAG: mevalonate kinase [Patescibacteria group bacterium]
MVIVSAPGKIYLMGEHAVVYGKPSLLAAINLRLRVSVISMSFRPPSRNPEKKDWIPGQARDDNGAVKIESTESDDYVRHILEVVKEHFKIDKLPPLKLTIDSDIPAGFHLGSSAAVAVATVGALVYFLKKIWNPVHINQLAYEAEKKTHGNPSGGDNTTVTMGGFIWFRKELEFLKSIWQIPLKLPNSLDHFFLINTCRPAETTGEMVHYVRAKSKEQRAKYINLFDENEEQTKKIAVALKTGDEHLLIDAIRHGEKTLEDMGVVSKKVTPLIRKIEKAGGAAKILGGGGKMDGVGFLLCYHHNSKDVALLCKPYGYSIQHIQLGEEGVRLEEK